jgi:integrase
MDQDNKIENIKNNLIRQLDKVMRSTNEKSIKTRYRYYEANKRFCGFLAKEYRLQKYANIKEKHFVRYAEYLKEEGYSASYQKTELSAIRFFAEKSGNKNLLPDNKKLDLGKREIGALDRAWTREEIDNAMRLAKSTGRSDLLYEIKMGSIFGMRLEEVCKCQVNHIKNAIQNQELYIRGKNGQIRYLHLRTTEQKELAKELLKYAEANKRLGTDRIIYDNVKGATEKEKKMIQNWITNHRNKFQDTSRERLEENKRLEEDAAKNGVKLKTENITFHGLRHYFAQQRFAYYLKQGYTEHQARINVSEELGHHRESVTQIYLSKKVNG